MLLGINLFNLEWIIKLFCNGMSCAICLLSSIEGVSQTTNGAQSQVQELNGSVQDSSK